MMTATVHEDFADLIQKNKGIIIKICNAYFLNKNDREDLAQEIIYQLWKSGNKFNTGYRFSTWMYRIALNVAISYYRKKKNATHVISLTDNATDIEDVVGNDETENNIRLMQQFISEMKELDKALILLYFESKSYKEIAEILGITETNVATRISRIKDRLKQNFSNLKKQQNGRYGVK